MNDELHDKSGAIGAHGSFKTFANLNLEYSVALIGKDRIFGVTAGFVAVNTAA